MSYDTQIIHNGNVLSPVSLFDCLIITNLSEKMFLLITRFFQIFIVFRVKVDSKMVLTTVGTFRLPFDCFV